jgi:hypothetical protein
MAVRQSEPILHELRHSYTRAYYLLGRIAEEFTEEGGQASCRTEKFFDGIRKF